MNKAKIKFGDNNCWDEGEEVEVVGKDKTHKNDNFDYYVVRGKNPNGRGYIKQIVPENFLEEVN